MPLARFHLLSIALLFPALPALAEAPSLAKAKAAASKTAWKPAWKDMTAPSENVELVNTPAQRLFSPIAAVRITNHLRDDDAAAHEILVGGYERTNVATLKLYQESTNRYTRVDIPPHLLTADVANFKNANIMYQGIGVSGKRVIIAGGTTGSLSQNSGKVFMIDAQTKKVESLPDLKVPRGFPMVGASPNGRLVLVAGGMIDEQRNGVASKTIEMIDRVTGKHVDLAEKFPGLAAGLPEGRYGGSIAWVQEPGVDRIFFVGGSSAGLSTNGGPTPLASTPTKTIHFYDCKKQAWGTMELPTPRMGPAVSVRSLPGGRQEIVVAGGGTGTTSAQRVDPQIYAVERIDPASLSVKFGESLPEQRGVYMSKTDRGSVAAEWGPNAMVLTTNGARTKAERVTTGARVFGFMDAYKTDALHGEPARPAPEPAVNISNTIINQTQINETRNETHINVDQTRINQTQISEKNEEIRIGR